MADVKTITVGGTTYNIKDATARSSIANMVTTNTEQTISAKKTFTGSLNTTTGFNLVSTSVTKGTVPTSTVYWGIRANDNANSGAWANTRLGILEWVLNTDNTVTANLGVYKNAAGSTNSSVIKVVYNTANSKAWAEAPSPDAGDNSGKIATTSWVQTNTNSKITAKFQKVNSLPSSPDANTWYAIPE